MQKFYNVSFFLRLSFRFFRYFSLSLSPFSLSPPQRLGPCFPLLLIISVRTLSASALVIRRGRGGSEAAGGGGGGDRTGAGGREEDDDDDDGDEEGFLQGEAEEAVDGGAPATIVLLLLGLTSSAPENEMLVLPGTTLATKAAASAEQITARPSRN